MPESSRSPHASRARSGTALRERGRASVENIVQAAQKILLNDGLAKFSLRRIADSLGISNGNVTYYFANKNALLRAVIEDLLAGYSAEFERQLLTFPNDPQARFLAYVDYLIDDCKRPQLRALFYQIWSIATHNAMVEELRDHIYEKFMTQIEVLLQPLNPSASAARIRDTSMVLIAMVEGLHVVFGLDPAQGFGASGMQRCFRSSALLVATSPSRESARKRKGN